MSDKYDKPHADAEGAGYSGVNKEVQKEMDAQVHTIRKEDEQQGGAIPDEAGHDFTFPDENESLGRKTGEDIPGEPDPHRQ